MQPESRVRCAVFLAFFATATAAATQSADPAVQHLLEARRLQQQGRVQEAAALYAQAVALRPQSPQVYLAASRFYEAQGRPADALAAVQAGLDVIPRDFALHAEAGILYAGQQDYVQAATHFARARDIQPSNRDNVANLANAYLKAAAEFLRRGQWAECLQYAEKALAVGHPLPRANYLAGIACFKNGQTDRAISLLTLAAGEEPDFWQPHFDLGLALSARNRWQEARQALARVTELQADYAPAYLHLGRALHELNRAEEAVPLFEKALKLDARLPLAHYHLGFALKGLARYAEAERALRAELALQPDYAPALLEMGRIAAETGEAGDALRYLRLALANGASAATVWYEIGKLQAAQGNYPDAIIAFRAHLKHRPESVEGHYGLFRALQRDGQTEEAARILAVYTRLSEKQRPVPQ